jgi:hypothetical protein
MPSILNVGSKRMTIQGLADEKNLYEWEILIIGYVF